MNSLTLNFAVTVKKKKNINENKIKENVEYFYVLNKFSLISNKY